MASVEDASKNTIKLENTEKRDSLIEIEKRYQKKWQEAKIFEIDAPTLAEDSTTDPDTLRSKHPKFFGTMAYPYMNGVLHAGHSFTLSKIEFSTGFARMEGKRALFPLGFHCTGMPIKASADKIVREIERFGEDFSGADAELAEDQTENAPPPPPAATKEKEDPTKFAAKKGKAAAKKVNLKYQFQIMKAIGVPKEEIPKFADPYYWLTYFPPLCQEHCNSFGARIDWRRSFLTTDANPYYDAFVRWQMNRLKELKKIKYGERYTIYSPKDKQPCMDHDRSEGEALNPQEYTGVKLEVLEWGSDVKELIASTKELEGVKVYMVAATLRPETMYGQTCCFVGPKVDYGIFKVNDKEAYLCTPRAARNMAFQRIFEEEGKFPQLASFQGSVLIGTLVNAPLSVHKDGVRILPMETVLATKGTGVVTCVPSDSPDDYATITDLAKKPEYYKIQKEWAEFEIVPIIKTPSYGDMSAPFLIKELKIASPKDKDALAKAKELAYKEGFYQGIMLIGDYKDMEVQKAKPLVREKLIGEGLAFAYNEPEGKVISRSGDECVVALLDQWYLDYGEEHWRKQVENHLENTVETYQHETLNAFKSVLGWLNQWACARSFGLGSRLPWDPQFLVESLSDSTIYMAYYTICHFLHSSLDGKKAGLLPISVEQMTDEVWDYVFTRRELSDEVLASGISKEHLETMRREFEYFYPLDFRCSGKDLIPNHFTFFLYIHCALFPPTYWPRGVRANGHLLLNGNKMSKSTGNFLTLEETIAKFGADASRIALADAGDSIEDANFEESTANAAILRSHTLKEWCESVTLEAKEGKLRDGPKDQWWDAVFENEMNGLIEQARAAYSATHFKQALKAGYYEFQSARDTYREGCLQSSIGMHKDLIHRWIEVQALMISPVAPHWADYIWQEVLGHPTTIQNELFPTPTAPFDKSLGAALEYVRALSGKITSMEAAQLKKMSKGKKGFFDPKKSKKVSIFVARNYPAWQDPYVELVRKHFDAVKISINDKALNSEIPKQEMKKAMPFIQLLKQKLVGAKEDPETVLDRKLRFDEVKTLMAVLTAMKKTTGSAVMEVVVMDDSGKAGSVVQANGELKALEGALPPAAEAAVPGVPTFSFENVEEEGAAGPA
ncbi:cytosolic leucyl tRNA synthetase [Orbilia oligospora]|nr:cytosolic leucyl tRNA synthetase [Orbilia oligospora]KAF3259207.1 cytosolic leucyl tRNA synthetase [Orbilia oligospora]KAF3269484.1 cytosolic leucyl tRNA synthetase [Orbilia oligospora]